ncbi:MAG: 6-phosphogluconolactonase [Dermatophilaceae bacterium]
MTRDARREVFPDKASTARAAGHALRERLAAAQRRGDDGQIVLTGGSMGVALIESLVADNQEGARSAPDWSRVHVWWGDERFLPTGDPERNDTQAYDAGLFDLGLTPDLVHPVPGPDGPCGDDVHAAAAAYAAELASASAGRQVPLFDVLMLGVGPDAHVASLFPGHEAQRHTDTTTVGVTGSPKPPSCRVSLTFPALRQAHEVWFLVAGADKADAVRLATSSTDPWCAPAAGVSGQDETIWWLDEAAAHGLGAD